MISWYCLNEWGGHLHVCTNIGVGFTIKLKHKVSINLFVFENDNICLLLVCNYVFEFN